MRKIPGGIILGNAVKGLRRSITTNKVSGSDGITVEPFKILKDDAVEVLHTICQYLENSTMAA